MTTTEPPVAVLTTDQQQRAAAIYHARRALAAKGFVSDGAADPSEAMRTAPIDPLLDQIVRWPNRLDSGATSRGWMPVGTLSGDPFISGTGDDYEGWSSPSLSGSVSVELTITDVNPAFLRMMTGSTKRIPALWPRMKHRAARRRAGYTRTGRRR